jgi:hypothetical protein
LSAVSAGIGADIVAGAHDGDVAVGVVETAPRESPAAGAAHADSRSARLTGRSAGGAAWHDINQRESVSERKDPR